MPKNEKVTVELTEELKQVLNIYNQAKSTGENTIIVGNIKKGDPVVKATSKDGVKYSTAESREIYKKEIAQKEADGKIKVYYSRSQEDKFIWMIYKLYQEINKYSEVLTSSDLTRLIYIATFVDWRGRLMLTEQTLMTKDLLKEKLRLSRNKFSELYKKLIDLNILIEYIDNDAGETIYYMNPDYFFKGELDKTTFTDNKRCTRLFTKEIQHLYESTTTKSHKTLSVLFRTIPYLNIKYNIVCKNPEEMCADLIQPMTMKELGEILGYSEKRIQELRKEFTNIKTTDNKYLIVFTTSDWNINYSKIIINPKVIYSGSDYKVVEGVGSLF